MAACDDFPPKLVKIPSDEKKADTSSGFVSFLTRITFFPESPNSIAFLKSKLGQLELSKGIFGSVIEEISPKSISEINLLIPKDKKILILGAGGVVPSIIFALNKMGVSEITISNRTKDRAEDLKFLFKDIKIVEWGVIPEFDIIINATSIGLNKDDQINLDLSKVGKNKFFYDVIYNPKETNFLKIGKKLGKETENGKLMFIYQAFTAFKVWHGVEPEINNEVIKLLDR